MVKTDREKFSSPQSSDVVEALRNTQRNQTVLNDFFDKPSQRANIPSLVSQFTDSSFNKGKGCISWEECGKNFKKISQESIPARPCDNSAATIHFNISKSSWHWRTIPLWIEASEDFKRKIPELNRSSKIKKLTLYNFRAPNICITFQRLCSRSTVWRPFKTSIYWSFVVRTLLWAIHVHRCNIVRLTVVHLQTCGTQQS